ncbi:MAG: hypothetical protein KatS3mg043_1903 [Rhodothermaceae bacterium]|nr:MAG: hypothetical protein KatS3mg043_1903 [Rhodothermaceae bacterium]
MTARRAFAWLVPLALLLACETGREAPAETSEHTTPPDPRMTAEADTLDLPETNYYEIATRYGRMVVRLYDETPLHRDNFKKLVARGFYDGTTFHRVIAGFMIQGGDPNSKDDDPYNDGQGGPGYTLPAEFHPRFYHKRGALATARQGDHVNPERRSSGSQFYIVHGTNPIDETMLAQMEAQIRTATNNPDFRFSDAARTAYLRDGGAPFLDMQYTVFGEVVEGFDVLDRIATTPTPKSQGRPAHPALGDQPLERVEMTVRPLPDYPPKPAG